MTASMLQSQRPVRASRLQAGNWVRLLEPLSPYSLDEALLLCEAKDNNWVVWIPDYGEAVLSREQFF